jgi:hypothetical protein
MAGSNEKRWCGMPALPGFRQLFYELNNDGGESSAYEKILRPYQSQALETMDALRFYGEPDALTWRANDPARPDPCNGGDSHDYSGLEHLYALSRVNELLTLPFQPVWVPENPEAAHANEWGPNVEERINIRLEERNAWLTSLGMRGAAQTTFHPFYHEIVEVEQAENPDEPISLLETFWPGFMLGAMLFCRAGVRIRAGALHAHKDIAEHSRLYWAYMRNDRSAYDRSHGWGSNSQWGTDFRRDYSTDDAYYYNVDGRISLNENGFFFDVHDLGDTEIDEDDAPYNTRPVLLELMTHRCLVVTQERQEDEYPYHLTWSEPRALTPIGAPQEAPR